MSAPGAGRPVHLLFAAPALIIYGLFILVPFAGTFVFSLHDWDGFGPMTWAGVSNYVSGEGGRSLSVARDEVFGRALGNNAIYWIVTLVSEVAAGLALAALLTRVRRGQMIYRLALSAPLMIALVASAVLWRQILAERGLLNRALDSAGLESLSYNWLDNTRVVYTVSLISGWAYAGFYMLIFNAGLERIPQDLREAAAIDGATGWRVFTAIELPLLRPVLAVAVLMCSTGAFRAFDLFYVMVGTGSNSRAEVASTWLVKNAFTFKSFGYAAALAVVMVIIVMGLAAALSRWVNRERELEY